MISESGYFYTSETGTKDTEFAISVNSAGRYKIITQKAFETVRPAGRVDFQLLYIAKGAAHFQIDGEMQRLKEGTVVLYFPEESQCYLYQLQDEPDVYWVHFTGFDVENVLANAGFPNSGVYDIGVQPEFSLLFKKMIRELQLKKPNYHALCNLYWQELLTLFCRYRICGTQTAPAERSFIEQAIIDFHQSYASPIQVQDYAQQLNVSACWFIRCFKRYTGVTPQRYITEIRISKAKELLYSTALSCTEIALNVGYSDPLYFSRMFKQQTGISPKEYRSLVAQKNRQGNF